MIPPIEQIEDLPDLVMSIMLVENDDLKNEALAAASRLYGDELKDYIEEIHALSEDHKGEDERIEACRNDVKVFCQTFFRNYCTVDFSRMHEDFFKRYADQDGKRGTKIVIAAPRGNAKTTIRTIIRTIYDCCYGIEDFIVVVSSTMDLAASRVRSIRDELEWNGDLNNVYGFKGTLVTNDWNQADFIVRNRWGHETRVLAASPKSQIRGLLWKGNRPTKIVLDDAENSENVLSEMQREKMRTWFFSDLSKLGTPIASQKRLNIDIVGTVLHTESLLVSLLDNPGYESLRYQAVLSFATNTALWAEWRDLFINLEDENREETALRFFETNKSAMLENVEVLWPEGETYYDLMYTRLVEGETSFWLEKQNDPQRSSRYSFDMRVAAYFTVFPDRLRRSDGTEVLSYNIIETVAYWDPATGEGDNPDWSACVVVAKDEYGYMYVLDAYMSQFDSPGEQAASIAEMLAKWGVKRMGLETNNFQSLLVQTLQEEVATLYDIYGDWGMVILPVKNTRNKERRILALQPAIDNRWLQFSDRLPREYYRQMSEWIPIANAGKDDGPDATEGAIRVLKHMLGNVRR